LPAGTNRVLVKVEQWLGRLGFALRLLDEDGRRRLAARTVRRHLEDATSGPNRTNTRSNQTFPEIAFATAWRRTLFGKNTPPFDGSIPTCAKRMAARKRRVRRRRRATTLDGYIYRQMLTFAKLRRALQRFRTPPFSELPILQVPGDPTP